VFARVQREDGSLEPAQSVMDASDEPVTGAYVTLDDGRRVQVLGYARQADGQLRYLVVALPR
jgi:hypothetical protein